MPRANPGTMNFWVRVFMDGVVRVGGKAVDAAIKAKKIGSDSLFWPPDTPIGDIVKYLRKKGVRVR